MMLLITEHLPAPSNYVLYKEGWKILEHSSLADITNPTNLSKYS